MGLLGADSLHRLLMLHPLEAASEGASRGGFFTPPVNNRAARGTTGGASRGSFFVPSSNNGTARGTTGGASRGSFFSPPPDATSPQGAAGGASRSNAYGEAASLPTATEKSMLAVMPDSFFGKTVEARPTILVYIPASNASEAVFSMKDEVKDSVYEMTIPVPASGGVVAVKLPSDAPELTVDQNYQWYLALKIDGSLKPGSPFVDGWVKRVSQNDEMAAAGSDAIAEISALGANGIWYDTAAKLAALQVGQADEAMSHHWYELLESVGLADIAAAPIVMGQ